MLLAQKSVMRPGAGAAMVLLATLIEWSLPLPARLRGGRVGVGVGA
jgi:hypothetical protein